MKDIQGIINTRTNKVLLVVLCLLTACTKQGQWSQEKIHSHCEAFTFSKVRGRSSNPVHGLDIEFIRFADNIKAYLIIHSTPIPCTICPGDKASLHIQIEQEDFAFHAERLEGGQRFLLTEEASELLIDTFLAGKDIIITLPGYRSFIQAEGFSKHFKKIERRTWENPFHLPF
jgi:hypothetical protein